MTYKHCGWLTGCCILGLLSATGMTENGRLDLLPGMLLMLALLAIGTVSGRAGLLLYAAKYGKQVRESAKIIGVKPDK